MANQTQAIRNFILKKATSPSLSKQVAARFQISPQAANRHIDSLVTEGFLKATGQTRSRLYELATLGEASFAYTIKDHPQEDLVWRKDVRPFLGELPQNVLDIWQWAFTEMFNNAVDHSGGSKIFVALTKTALDAQILIDDDGVGIFSKIQKALNLPDERQAIFELSKGKLTTDEEKHSGQGIFFTSRMVSNFDILSGGVYFSHEVGNETDWLSEREISSPGTTIFLKVTNHTTHTTKKVLDRYSVEGSYGFNKTVVPVELARYGTDQLVSRSQAKRVLTRVELFTQVIFDFTGVPSIGQAFADEIFRVFSLAHPDVELIPSHANAEIMGLIQATIRAGRPGFKGK